MKLILKLISIADCAPSFELVRRRKYSEWAIFTARVAVKIAEWLSLRLAVNIASAYNIAPQTIIVKLQYRRRSQESAGEPQEDCRPHETPANVGGDVRDYGSSNSVKFILRENSRKVTSSIHYFISIFT